MSTRIVLRNDTPANWGSSGATELNKGELAFSINTQQSGDVTRFSVIGRLGIDPEGAEFGDCPIVAEAYGSTGVPSEAEGDAPLESSAALSKPVVYEDIASKQDGTTVRWDATNEKWVADAQVVTIDTYPTANGTVVYDASLSKFVVGAVVSATVIDGGSY